jgi:hypothetical protein
MNGLGDALGHGWLGALVASLVTLVIGGLGGWIARRPLEKAGVLEAVNERMKVYMTHLEGELERITAHHRRCEERLDQLEAQGRRDREEIALLRGQVAQEKQTAASIARVKGEGQ